MSIHECKIKTTLNKILIKNNDSVRVNNNDLHYTQTN